MDNFDGVLLAWPSSQKLFSVWTSPRGNRCFVLTDDDLKFCHYEKCKGAQTVTVGSSEASVRDFNCLLLQKVNETIDQPE